MAYWATSFHRSDGDEASLKRMQSMRNDIVEMQWVVGNNGTENTFVHDVIEVFDVWQYHYPIQFEGAEAGLEIGMKLIENAPEIIDKLKKVFGHRKKHEGRWLSPKIKKLYQVYVRAKKAHERSPGNMKLQQDYLRAEQALQRARDRIIA